MYKDPFLWLVLSAALFLFLYTAMTTPLIWDEDMDWIPLAKSISLQIKDFNLPIRGDFHPALPAYFIKTGELVFGRGHLKPFRVASLLAGLLTVVIAYKLALEWSGVAAARWTAVLLAFNEYFIYVSSTATEKGFFLLFAMLSIYFFARFLRNERASNLFAAAAMVGLAYLCKEIALILLPPLFLSLLLPGYRKYFHRKEPYLALLIFLLVISPDLSWNLLGRTSDQQRFTHFLMRHGGLGFTPYYFLFYFRGFLLLVGKMFVDGYAEYASMNPVFGVTLLGFVAAMTFRVEKRDAVDKFLLFIFYFVLLFFVFSRPTENPENIQLINRMGADILGWLWVDLTLIPAVVLSGKFLAGLKKPWLTFAYVIIGAAVIISVITILYIFPRGVESISGTILISGC